MPLLVEANEDDKKKKEIMQKFVDELDQYSGFVIVVFRKGDHETGTYWSCRTHDIAVASVELANAYNSF